MEWHFALPPPIDHVHQPCNVTERYFQNQSLVDMHPDTNLVTCIDMHIDRPLDFQSVDVRNPQRMHLRTLFGHHHSHSTSGTLNECTYAHYSVITTGLGQSSSKAAQQTETTTLQQVTAWSSATVAIRRCNSDSMTDCIDLASASQHQCYRPRSPRSHSISVIDLAPTAWSSATVAVRRWNYDSMTDCINLALASQQTVAVRRMTR